jgi:ligand-binding sensor domain-containing protein
MTLAIKNPVRCTALVVVFLLAGARGELTLAQDFAPDPYFSPIADKSTALMPRVILRNIREDRDGNIWFASYGGPIRYDGKAFTNFGEEAGIAERRIFSLIVDKSGALWFGSITAGASKYDGKSFTRFQNAAIEQEKTEGTDSSVASAPLCGLNPYWLPAGSGG